MATTSRIKECEEKKKNRNRTQFLQVKAELCLSFKDKQTTGANHQIAKWVYEME